MQHHQPRNAQTDSNDTNTKKAAKRRKMRTKNNKPHTIRKPNAIALIYQEVTEHNLAVVADDATEKRLKSYGPSTSKRSGPDNYIW